MLIYLLKEVYNDSIGDDIILVSTNKKLVYNRAIRLSKKEVASTSWQHKSYWIYVFDSKTGKEVDEIEFDTGHRNEKTFGKQVRNRGTIDEETIGSWYK